jgi:Fur family ferric uptake transcriptional regulator
MCHQCDYSDLLKARGLGITRNRLRVLEIIGSNNFPLSAGDIYKTLDQRLSGGGRSFVYGLAPSEHHPAHPHFFCKSCGHLECLNPQSLNVDTEPIQRTFPGMIQSIEVRVDGVCKTCLKT